MNIKNITTSSFANLKFNCKKPKKKLTENNNFSFAGNSNTKITKDVFVKFMSATQAQNGIDDDKISKRNIEVQKLASMVEDSINSGIEDEILKYHKLVKRILKSNKTRNNGIFRATNGVKFSCMHDFRTIQIEQKYKGVPYNYNWYYEGYPKGRKPKEEYEHQTAFAYCNNYDSNHVEYNFRNYNLDDEHGNTDTLVLNDKFLYIETSHDCFSPYHIRYSYDKNGKLKQAKVRIYNKTKTDLKESVLMFDKNRKVSEIYYDIKTSNKGFCDNYLLAGSVYKRNEQGEFELLMQEMPFES